MVQQRKFLVKRAELNLQDLVVNFDEATLLTNAKVFNLEDNGIEPAELIPSLVT